MLAAALALNALPAAPAQAQPGAPPASPPPAGLKPGTGAPFPKGHGAQLDSLPDWGGIWFFVRSPDSASRPTPPEAQGKIQSGL